MKQLLAEVEIPWHEAVWVLAAHAYALLVPIALITAVQFNWDYLTTTTDWPFLFYIAAGLLCAGSAFEVAQNTFDRWYLTAESPSANGTGISDFLFYWLVTAGQALCAVAISGDTLWVMLAALVTVIVFPLCYLLQIAHFAPLGIATLLAIVLAYRAFGDPVVFLQLLMAATTMYFFAALLKTEAQVMHGFTTLAASSGVWFFIWAVNNGASGLTNSWTIVLYITLGMILAGIALWPALARLPASPRVVRRTAEA